jgi:hypothetical protein
MKFLSFLFFTLCSLFFLSGFATAKTITLKEGDLTFTFDLEHTFETPGVEKKSSNELHAKVSEVFHNLRRVHQGFQEGEKIHPLDFEAELQKIHPTLELGCIVGGDLDFVLNLRQIKEGSTWIWNKVNWTKVSLKIILNKEGEGVVEILQDNKLVGMVASHFSKNRELEVLGCQPKGVYTVENNHEGNYREKTHISKEVEGAKMHNSVCFSKDRGLYLHYGDISTESRGCGRLSFWASSLFYEKLPKGTKIEFVWED